MIEIKNKYHDLHSRFSQRSAPPENMSYLQISHVEFHNSSFSVNRSFCQICQKCITAEKIQQKVTSNRD